MNMKLEITALSVLLCFTFIATLVQSSPVLENRDYELHSLSKREAEEAKPEAEPESSTGTSEPEPESSSSTPGAESEPGKNGTTGEKKGFFKTIGENIKNGASSAMEKVKSTANNVKDSVKKAVNNAAAKVKDATDEKTTTPGCKTTGVGTFSITPQNLQDVNCTMDTSTEMVNSTGEPQEVSTSNSKKKRSADGNTSKMEQGQNNKMKIQENDSNTTPMPGTTSSGKMSTGQ